MSYFLLFFQDKSQEHEDQIKALSRTVIQQAAQITGLDVEVERIQTALSGVQVSQ